MGTKQPTTLAAGWIQDSTTLLYHYYREEAGLAAHPSLCNRQTLVTATVRRNAAARPEGVAVRYANSNRMATAMSPGICKACANRHANLKK
jgi:hypothetical protein